MKKSIIIGICVILTFFFLIGVFVLMTISNYVKASEWDIRDPMPDDRKELFANVALMPELSQCFERYAVKGMRDADYMIETYRYADIEDMYAALPDGCDIGINIAVSAGDSEKVSDISDSTVLRYMITSDLPLLSRDDLDDRYKNSYLGAFIKYYVLKYPDGTYRFAVLVNDM